ncbi:hypothetical protein SCHPADRAFT_412557 [Schizopora paradoxa]|uniref:Plectin/eS10 N-terminal domain-containing protein n=1 Tax=Schizopora paradoxa TaxID=27342 RepID=A0A0H2S6V5_9AGAM|nr:hypothetical protein SCHPADRAFT_412557 [Schizopora paradoxa]
MFIRKENRKLIHESLFKEGVLVCKKDYNQPEHDDLPVPNLEVIKAMQSLTSKGYVKTQFSWAFYYYSLTPAGLDYLREELHLPAEIVPATHKKAVKPVSARSGRVGGGDGAYRPPRGDRGERDEYRRRDRDEGGKKEDGAPGEFRPRFAGVGRGAPRE